MSQKEEIKFYAVGASYGEFSCFAVYPIRVKGKIWPTTEHYYQAQKYAGTSQELAIQKAATPAKAAELGRTKKMRVRPTWDNVKDNIMMEAMRAKFSQYADLKALLLGTEDAQITLHTEADAYWGDGGDGKGLNKLGKILMKVREELQNA
jgi:ribA/ribD-fused uncharacterized protein